MFEESCMEYKYRRAAWPVTTVECSSQRQPLQYWTARTTIWYSWIVPLPRYSLVLSYPITASVEPRLWDSMAPAPKSLASTQTMNSWFMLRKCNTGAATRRCLIVIKARVCSTVQSFRKARCWASSLRTRGTRYRPDDLGTAANVLSNEIKPAPNNRSKFFDISWLRKISDSSDSVVADSNTIPRMTCCPNYFISTQLVVLYSVSVLMQRRETL